ncbi:MAG: hypothetical protein R2860_02110 [Desulfobacterales bacterium]
MKLRCMVVCLLILCFSFPAQALTGREIMEKSDALAQPDTAKSKVLMLIHKGGRVQEKGSCCR